MSATTVDVCFWCREQKRPSAERLCRHCRDKQRARSYVQHATEPRGGWPVPPAVVRAQEANKSVHPVMQGVLSSISGGPRQPAPPPSSMAPALVAANAEWLSAATACASTAGAAPAEGADAPPAATVPRPALIAGSAVVRAGSGPMVQPLPFPPSNQDMDVMRELRQCAERMNEAVLLLHRALTRLGAADRPLKWDASAHEALVQMLEPMAPVKIPKPPKPPKPVHKNRRRMGMAGPDVQAGLLLLLSSRGRPLKLIELVRDFRATFNTEMRGVNHGVVRVNLCYQLAQLAKAGKVHRAAPRPFLYSIK